MKRELRDAKEVFKSVYRTEQQHKDRYVVYHGMSHGVGFFVETLTELRSILSIESGSSMRTLRDSGVLRSAIDTLDNFLAEQLVERTDDRRENGGIAYDHRSDYKEKAISTNIFLFGNEHIEGESTFMYFLNNHSRVGPRFLDAMGKLFETLGLSADRARYHAMEVAKLARSVRSRNGCLLQILIHPSVINKLVYMSGVWGMPIESAEGRRVIPSEFLEKVRTDPLAVVEWMKTLKIKGKDPINMSTVQARLFLEHNLMHDPEKVQVVPYWRNPLSSDSEKAHSKALKRVLSAAVKEVLKSEKGILRGPLKRLMKLRERRA